MDCQIKDCGDPVMARELCAFHYGRWLKHGDPLAGGPRRARRGSLTKDQRREHRATSARKTRAKKGPWRPPDGLCTKCKQNPCAGTSTWCNPCLAAKARERRKDPATRARMNGYASDSWLRRKYGLSRGDYDALLARQGGVCALCGEPPKRYRLAVDHDHVTGAIRALLCSGCNRSLGWVEARGVDVVVEYLHRNH